MEIYLVRHTQTVCEKGVCYGQTDMDILQPYETIFEEIVTQLPDDAVLFSSSLLRCTCLADYIQQNKNISSYTKDHRLKEMNFGDWELQNWNDIPPNELNPWMEDFVAIRVPNGESFIDLHERVIDFLEKELKNQPFENLIIVGHAGIIRSILCYFSGLPLKDAFQNKVDYGQVIKISVEPKLDFV